MPLIASKSAGKDFPLLPEGIVNLTVTEVKDLGMQPIDAQYRKPDGPTERHKIRLRFADENGVSAIRDYTLSLDDKANLTKDLKQIFGTAPADKLDVFTLVGTNARAVITHEVSKKNGKTYANIVSFMKAAAGQKANTAAQQTVTQKANEPELVDVGF